MKWLTPYINEWFIALQASFLAKATVTEQSSSNVELIANKIDATKNQDKPDSTILQDNQIQHTSQGNNTINISSSAGTGSQDLIVTSPGFLQICKCFDQFKYTNLA